MGCGGSKSVAAVQPLDDEAENVSKVEVLKENGVSDGLDRIQSVPDNHIPNGSPADQPDQTSTQLNPASPPQLLPVKQANGSSAIAFEIPLEAGESLIQRHPPKRFQRLEDNQLTLEIFEGKHANAAERRSKLLNQRVQSARVRNLRSAGRAKSRTTMRSDDDPIEGGVADQRKDESELS
ncbi:uncharacterized protein LOC119093738 [Pollicipes pollicipes]|uniref:uncharacterized protein LOC119093738 n=1 Tax=Pollicipes pollicipes TaxID=41117 RepID=UPI00188512A3|nr:uncharacterized protein LOC119093738 [Pollicipes pollicipes]